MDIRSCRFGITGFMSQDEMKAALDSFDQYCQTYAGRIDHRPLLRFGILASSKTIKGIQNKYPERYPKIGDMRELFSFAGGSQDSRVQILCHYSTDTPENLFYECEVTNEVLGSRLDGFQFNVPWPDPEIIKRIAKTNVERKIVLQIGKRALDQFGIYQEGELISYDDEGIYYKVHSYLPFIDEVLIDPSGGKGIAFSPMLLVPLVRTLLDTEVEISIAGGLSSQTMDNVRPIREVCRSIGLGIDAEGRLRNPETKEMDLKEVDAYLRSAFNLFYVPP